MSYLMPELFLEKNSIDTIESTEKDKKKIYEYITF